GPRYSCCDDTFHLGTAKEFRMDLFPRKLSVAFGPDKSPFAADAFFDGSRTKQTALVGAYETCSGKHVAFFLIIGWPEGKPPEVRFLHEMQGDKEFAALSVSRDGAMTVYHCLECDS